MWTFVVHLQHTGKCFSVLFLLTFISPGKLIIRAFCLGSGLGCSVFPPHFCHENVPWEMCVNKDPVPPFCAGRNLQCGYSKHFLKAPVEQQKPLYKSVPMEVFIHIYEYVYMNCVCTWLICYHGYVGFIILWFFFLRSIGYPVVTLGFGFKSYVSYKMRLRKQKEVQKENEFYMQLLQQALPPEQQMLQRQEREAEEGKWFLHVCSVLCCSKGNKALVCCCSLACFGGSVVSSEGQKLNQFGGVNVARKGNCGPSAQFFISSCINLVSQRCVKL